MIIKKEFHIPVTSKNIIAVDLLAEAFQADGLELSRQKIKQAMQKGSVWLEKGKYTQRLRRAKKILSQGDILHCYYDSGVLDMEPPEAILISDEGAYSIWNKPSGMLSQGSKWGDHCTVYRWAEKHLLPERPAFIVHRLDRAASGLIIVAHKKKIAAEFSKMFKQRDIEKHYQVRVVGDLSLLPLNDNQQITVNKAIDDKTALSHFQFLEFDSAENESLLNVHIETGRKHQIRKHLSELDYPVVGDRLYGNEESGQGEQKDLQLTAVSLKFICPITAMEKLFKV